MPSIIPGYEYDIFISYRQKDNRGERWVSEFVEALKTELESTFKEEISVYFDINPHDGLLVTHDVDASLKEKLKCLIFIPIISRTYCDPKSFAWEHEFKAFVEIASKDQFGLKVKLPNGNVSSRVLPVRIHDLDQSDVRECEAVLGSFLRGIEFIYKEPGVNKPLSVSDDEKVNLNKTKYRIQINRTANAIMEIIRGLRNPDVNDGASVPAGISNDKKKFKHYGKGLAAAASAIILVIAAILLFSNPFRSEKEIRIAVIPLENLNRDTVEVDLSTGFTQDIINSLNDFDPLTVRSFNSSSQFKSRTKSTREIMKVLEVDYLVDGSFETYGDSFKLRLSMIDVKDKQRWHNEPVIHRIKFTSLAGNIAREIVSEIGISPALGDLNRTEEKSTDNSEAYKYFISGESSYLKNSLSGDKAQARGQYEKAIELDPTYAKAWAGVANCYFDEFFFSDPDPDILKKCKDAIDKAFETDGNLPEAHLAMGNYYYGLRKFDLALKYYNTAVRLKPKNSTALFWTALLYRRTGEWEKAISLMEEALKIDPSRSDIYAELANACSVIRDYPRSELYSGKAISLQPDNNDFPSAYSYMVIKWKGDTSAAGNVIENYQSGFSKYNCLFNYILDNTFQKSLKEISQLPQEGIRELDLFIPRSMFYARVYGLMKNSEKEIAWYDSARIYLEQSLEKHPDNPSIMSSLGVVYAGLGQYNKAIGYAQGSLTVMPYEKDAIRGDYGLTDLAFVFMKAGRYEDAFRELDFLLSNPSGMSIKILEVDPKWKSLKDQPGFSKLVAKFSPRD